MYDLSEEIKRDLKSNFQTHTSPSITRTQKKDTQRRGARAILSIRTERERGKNLTGEKSCGLRAKVFLFSSLRKIRAIGIFLFRERDINKQSSTTRARGSLFLSAVVRKERERELDGKET